jgi:N-acetylneuraminate synthase/N,N'-diacetyllegionaminate synthase
MTGELTIAGRRIGSGAPCFVIAEAGVNHNGSIDKAIALVDAAAASGADAVKFQTFSADRLASADAPKARYQMEGTPEAESQRDMLRRLELDEAAHRILMTRAAERRILFLSSPFDEESADLLERLRVAAFKIPSGELTNHRFLEHVACKRLPMIVSTGMATLAEVEEAVAVIRRSGAPDFALLHCVSAYPAPPEDANLRAMATLAGACGVPAGWSDHTPGTEIAIAAVALGAAIVEKHLTLDRTLPGPDHAASLEPDDFGVMVAAIRNVAAALGDGIKRPTRAEEDVAAVARKSLVARRDLPVGHVLEITDLGACRPGTGLAPALLPELVGRTLSRTVREGEMLSREALA